MVRRVGGLNDGFLDIRGSWRDVIWCCLRWGCAVEVLETVDVRDGQLSLVRLSLTAVARPRVDVCSR